MILEKRLNGLWWFYDAFYTGGFTPYPFGCIIDKTANTFVLTKENRPSYPKEPLPVAEVKIRVLPSTSLETYSTANLLENRLLGLGFPPLVVDGSGGGVVPDGIVIDKGTLNPTTTTITSISGETHFYRITANGDVNGTLPVKVGDVVGISSSGLWIESNNNQSNIFNWIREATPRLLSNSITQQKVFLKDFYAKANKRYKFELMFEVSGLSGALGFDFGFDTGIESNFRYTLGTKYNSPLVNSAFSYITTNAGMINTSASSSSTGYFVFVTGTFVTSNANKLVKPVLRTSIAQAAAYINNSFFVCWEIGESGVGFNGDFQNN